MTNLNNENDADYLSVKAKVDANRDVASPCNETILFDIYNEAKSYKLTLNEASWEEVERIIFQSPCIEIQLKDGNTVRIMHDWAYESINNPTNSELDKIRFYKEDGCQYRFSKDSRLFLDWIWDESKKRGVFFQF